MADATIDSLVVKLGLDASEFKQGTKEVGQDLDATRKTTDRTARDISANGKRAAEFFGQLEKAALKFFAVITVGRGLSDFTRTIIQTGAQLDRMAGYFGTSADRLSRWQGAVRQSGGTAEGLTGTMQGLSSALTELRLTGTTGILPFLQSLQVSLADTATGKAKPLEQILLDISDAVKTKIPKGDQYNFMKLLGIDDGTANLLLKSRTEIEHLLSAQKAYSDADAKAAREAQEKWEGIKLNIERTTQQLVTQALPTLERMALAMEKFAVNAVPVLIRVGEAFSDLDEATDGWSTTLIVALGTLRLIGGPGVLGGIGKLRMALLGVAGAAALLKGDTSEQAQYAQGLSDKAASGDRGAAVELAKVQLNNQFWRKWFGGKITEEDINSRADEIQAGAHGGAAPKSWSHPRGEGVENPYKPNESSAQSSPTGQTPATIKSPADTQSPATPAGGDSGKSRAERNNNPGNLEFRGQAGASRENGEGRFAKFETAEEGVAALARQLQLYASRGIDTIESIISKYAPPNENNTKAYIEALTSKLGVKADQKLDLSDAGTMSGLIQGISRHEAGRSFLSDQQILSGLSMAGMSPSQQQQPVSMSIGEVKVYTQATDAPGIARDFRGAMIRQADSGVQ